MGFHEEAYNEARQAKEIARYLGTDHTELYVSAREAMAIIPRLPALYGEPFADPSQIPTFLVAQLARQQVTVSLSGDGGDELFSGYYRYIMGAAFQRKVAWMPGQLRKLLAKGLLTVSPTAWGDIFEKLSGLLPKTIKKRDMGDKLHKVADMLMTDSPEAMYQGMVSHWKSPGSLVKGATEPLTVLTDARQWANLTDFSHRMMYLDTMTYLSDGILTKLDRATMGVSLEGRIPYLDHRVAEFAWQLPLSMKIKNGQGKWLLKQVQHRYIPEKLTTMPKMGFGVPIDSWLRGPLREWAEELLDERRLQKEGYFEPALVRDRWIDHLSGRQNCQYSLWNVLVFQSWLESQT
jgi:asparagine synthase (glutamine-hydrolysing)